MLAPRFVNQRIEDKKAARTQLADFESRAIGEGLFGSAGYGDVASSCGVAKSSIKRSATSTTAASATSSGRAATLRSQKSFAPAPRRKMSPVVIRSAPETRRVECSTEARNGDQGEACSTLPAAVAQIMPEAAEVCLPQSQDEGDHKTMPQLLWTDCLSPPKRRRQTGFQRIARELLDADECMNRLSSDLNDTFTKPSQASVTDLRNVVFDMVHLARVARTTH